MKRIFLVLCTVSLICCVAMCGCSKKDLTDYHEVGYSWVLSYEESDYYEITFTSYSENTVYVDLEICDEHLDDEYVYFYSVGFDLECNGVHYDELLVPFIFPIGMYQVPIEGSHLSLKLTTDEKVDGYLKARLDSQPSSSLEPLKMIKFSIY